MSRSLRRLVAGALAVAALTVTAPAANASCYTFKIAGRYYYVCV